MESKRSSSCSEMADESTEGERNQLQRFIKKLEEKYEKKATLRAENLDPKHSQPPTLRCLPSVRKNAAFVMRLKRFTSSQLEGILCDLRGLNLTRYITEVSAALVQAKLKIVDIRAAVTVSCELHQLYPDFATHFYEQWQQALRIKSGRKIVNRSKMLVDLQFYSELVSVGLFGNIIGLPLLVAVLSALISQDQKEHYINLAIIVSFCKHCGDEFLGLVPKDMAELAERFRITIPTSKSISPGEQLILCDMLKGYYHTLVEHLQAEYKKLRDATTLNRRELERMGHISKEKETQTDILQSLFDHLHSSTAIMAEILGEEEPVLMMKVEEMPLDACADQASLMDPWDDEELKSFYVDLPDLKLYTPDCSASKPEATELASSSIQSDPAGISESTNDEHARVARQFAIQERFKNYVRNLTKCTSQEMIDNAAIEFFVHLNTKNNRKRLVTALFNVYRTRLDLLPLYARLVAILNQMYSSIATELCEMLKNAFISQIEKKDQLHIESKVKVVRFIGELVKFGLYQKQDALHCWHCLLLNFQHHQINMACAFLEVCGAYLYNSPESHLRTNELLEQMTRLKEKTVMDARYILLIESVQGAVKRPKEVQISQKALPPMHAYVDYLLFDVLDNSNAKKVIELLRQLNWDDQDMHDYAVGCLSKAYKVRYLMIRSLAHVVAGMGAYQREAINKVIDAVFEDIRVGLEIPVTNLAQRHLAMVKYLGELYNYRLIEYENIINTLYSIISVGVASSHETPSESDPPGSFFRLKLACVLLDTCGAYFPDDTSREALDYFFVFLQHYYWFKKSDPYFRRESTKNMLPVLIDHMYTDCLRNLRPNLKLAISYEEAKISVHNLRESLCPEPERSKTTVATEQEEADCETIVEEHGSGKDQESDSSNKKEVENSDCVINVMKAPAAKSLADIEFDRDFERTLLESYQEQLATTSSKAVMDVVPPAITFFNAAKKAKQAQERNLEDSPSDSVSFVLLLRGKGKHQRFKTFEVSRDNHLANYVSEQEQKLQEEKNLLKQLTLDIAQLLQKEDEQESEL